MKNVTQLSLDGSAAILRTRIIILEATLAGIDRECSQALDVPQVSFVTLCRVAALTRQALRERSDRPS